MKTKKKEYCPICTFKEWEKENACTMGMENHIRNGMAQILAMIKGIEVIGEPSRELSLVKTKLQEAQMWFDAR